VYSIDVSAIACPIVGEDLCGDAVPVDLAAGATLTFAGDNSTATFAGDAVPGSLLDQFPFANTWHAFTTSECVNVTVSYCATDSGWATIWRLLTVTCPADAVINATSSEQTTCANGNWTFTFSELPAGTYYLPVPNVGFGQGGGPYTIEVSATACAVAAADLCDDAVPVALAAGGALTFTGDNTQATFNGDAVDGSLLDEYPFPNTWHAFTTTECLDVTVNYCGTDSGWSTIWRLLTQECPANTVLNATSSEQTTCANGNWTFTFNQLPAGTYYLPVPNVGFGQGGGPYSIEVVAVDCDTTVGTVDLTTSGTATWMVYPNPSSGEITITSFTGAQQARLDVLDMSGRLVFSEQEQLGGNGPIQLSLAGRVAPGTYLLRMTTPESRSEQRLILK
jgi:hypothetical protein